jgi:hypothetical protein
MHLINQLIFIINNNIINKNKWCLMSLLQHKFVMQKTKLQLLINLLNVFIKNKRISFNYSNLIIIIVFCKSLFYDAWKSSEIKWKIKGKNIILKIIY